MERALQAVTSLECLSSIAVLTQADSVNGQDLSERGMTSFSTGSGTGIHSSREDHTDLGKLLNGHMVHENFTSLELDENLLGRATLSSPHTPLIGHIQRQFSSSANVSLSCATLISHSSLEERSFTGTYHELHESSHSSQRPLPAEILSKTDIPSQQQYSRDHPHSSPHDSHYDSEHGPSPYNDQMTSPHAASFTGDGLTDTFSSEVPIITQHLLTAQIEVPLSGVINAQSHWGNLPVNLADPSMFSTFLSSDGHLLSTSLSTPQAVSHSEPSQPTFSTVTPNSSIMLPGLPQTSFSGLSPPPSELMDSPPSKQQLPQFIAAFGHQLTSHSGIPKDLQPSHSSIAPPAGFTVTGATATSTNNTSSSITKSN